MTAIRAIFWDVGGVLLTNAWDRVERSKALEQFHLDLDEFHDRHEMVVSSFERGKVTLDEYMDRTVFSTIAPGTGAPGKSSVQILAAVEGCGVVEVQGRDPVTLAKGDAVVLPAAVQTFTVRPQWTVEFLKAYVPGATLPEPATRL